MAYPHHGFLNVSSNYFSRQIVSNKHDKHGVFGHCASKHDFANSLLLQTVCHMFRMRTVFHRYGTSDASCSFLVAKSVCYILYTGMAAPLSASSNAWLNAFSAQNSYYTPCTQKRFRCCGISHEFSIEIHTWNFSHISDMLDPLPRHEPTNAFYTSLQARISDRSGSKEWTWHQSAFGDASLDHLPVKSFCYIRHSETVFLRCVLTLNVSRGGVL